MKTDAERHEAQMDNRIRSAIAAQCRHGGRCVLPKWHADEQMPNHRSQDGEVFQ